jgi:hypothetical protein
MVGGIRRCERVWRPPFADHPLTCYPQVPIWPSEYRAHRPDVTPLSRSRACVHRVPTLRVRFAATSEDLSAVVERYSHHMRRIAVFIALFAFTLISCRSVTTKTVPGPTTTVAGPTVTVTTTSSPTSTPVAATCLTADQASAIVSRDKGKSVQLDSPGGFGCADGWAYVNYTIPPNLNHATEDLQFVGGAWTVGDRLIACGTGTTAPAMSPALVLGGCGN